MIVIIQKVASPTKRLVHAPIHILLVKGIVPIILQLLVCGDISWMEVYMIIMLASWTSKSAEHIKHFASRVNGASPELVS